MDGVKKHLLKRSKPSGLFFIAELPNGVGNAVSNKMDHLVCFLGGNLALGATHGLPASIANAKGASQRNLEDLQLGAELTRTCYEMYARTESKLAPEIAWFNTDEEDMPDFEIRDRDAHNLMRPETVESLFILWRITKDERYRAWAWDIFCAFEEWAQVEDGAGYTSLNDVRTTPPPKRNNMESFWVISILGMVSLVLKILQLAETLKYLYLIFGPDDVLPLDRIVFNTEAHPFPMYAWPALVAHY